MREQVILMFSGGLDSTYVLWEMLTKTELPVHCHHIELRTGFETRWMYENAATRDIYRYCESNYRRFSQGYSQYHWPAKSPYVGWDSDLILVEAQKAAGNFAYRTDIDRVRVYMGWCQDDLERDVVKDRVDRNVTPDLWKALHASLEADQRKVVADTLCFPLLEQKKYKKDMLIEMPPALVDLAWTCRRPAADGSTCNQCHACRTMAAANAGRVLRE